MTGKHIPHVLYIEDDLEMIDLVALILSRRGIHVKGIQSTQLTLETIRLDPPSLFLLDLMMPEVDGWDVLRLIKSDPLLQTIPVVILTAKTQPIDRVLGLEIAHVDAYISKPFHPDELLACLDAIFTARS